MTVDMTISDCAAEEIAKLEAEGIHPTPAEIVRLNALGHEILTPVLRIRLARGCPVYLAGIPLWPLTLCAEDWYRREGLPLDGVMSDVAFAYAMAHAYDETGKLDEGGVVAVRSIKEWRRKLRCTYPQMREAIAQVLAQDELPPVPQNVDDRPLTDGEFSIILSVKTKTPPEFWERRCSRGYARAALVAVFMQERADNAPHPLDPSVQAELAFGLYAEEIRKAHSNV